MTVTPRVMTGWQYWTTFAALSMVLGFGSMGYTQMYARLSAVEDRQHLVLERLAALDVQIAALNQADELARRDREQMNQKLDRLLLTLSGQNRR